MNTVRSCSAASVLLLSVIFGSRLTISVAGDTDAIARTCCSTPGSGRPVCRYQNRTFHTIEIIGDEPCPEQNDTSANARQLIRKCCPPDWVYEPGTRTCRPAFGDGSDSVRQFRRLITTTPPPLPPDRILAVVIGYYRGSPMCQDGDVLVDEPMAAGRPLPDDYGCFDMTPLLGQRLVTRTCRPRGVYCGGSIGPYMCVNKCCRGDRMIGPE